MQLSVEVASGAQVAASTPRWEFMLRIRAHPTKIKVAIDFILVRIERYDSCYCAEFTGNCDILCQRNSPFYSEILDTICKIRFAILFYLPADCDCPNTVGPDSIRETKVRAHTLLRRF